ncbi:MAG: HrpE/YscL family type III secretion apparatus protein [Simkania negevensis]|nr:HrpE/YscL family type III secretion apparatus protein [Simkania negevensis]
MKYFSLIYSGEIHEGSGEKVIPAEELSTLLSAQEVLEEAKKDVTLYLDKNKEECQKLLKEAKEAGFNKGLSEFNKQILFFEQKMREFEHKLQQMVLPLALKAAKKIVGNLLETRPEAIVEIVRGALKAVTQNRHVKIYVNKKDREELEKNKGRVKEVLEHVLQRQHLGRLDARADAGSTETGRLRRQT